MRRPVSGPSLPRLLGTLRCAWLIWPFLLSTLCATQVDDSPQRQIERLLNRVPKELENGQTERAESDSREALGIALDQLGNIYSTLKEFDLAEKAYLEASRASVYAPRSLVGLAVLYLRTGRYEEGIAAVKKTLELNPLNPKARHVLGKIYFMQGDYRSAASELRDSYRAGSADASVSYTLALATLLSGDKEAAVKVFREMVAHLGETPQLHMLFGRAYRDSGFLDDAEREFRRAIELDPGARRAHYYLGLTVLRAKGRAGFEEAKEQFRQEVGFEPDAYFGNFYLGLVLNQNSEHAEAVGFLEKATLAEPDNPDAFLYLGMSLAQIGRDAEAESALRKAIALTSDPSRNNFQIASAHYLIGRSLQRRGEMEEAARELKLSADLKAENAREEPSILEDVLGTPPPTGPTAVAQLAEKSEPPNILGDTEPDPQSRQILLSTTGFHRAAAARACLALGQLRTQRSEFKAAADYFQRAVFWDETLPEGYFNLAVARVKAGELGEAARALISELKRNPSNQQARRLLANLSVKLVEERERDPAEEAVDFLLEGNPEVAQLHILKGHLNAQRTRFEEAIKEYRTALARNASLPEAHYFIGTVLIRLGRLSEALGEFEAELRLNPDHPKALYHKAFVLLSEGKDDEALELLQRVVVLQPNYSDAYYQLGKKQLGRGQLLVALANLETAAHLNPNSPYVFYQLYRAYQKSGRMQDAKQALAHYRELKRAQEEAGLRARETDIHPEN